MRREGLEKNSFSGGKNQKKAERERERGRQREKLLSSKVDWHSRSRTHLKCKRRARILSSFLTLKKLYESISIYMATSDLLSHDETVEMNSASKY